MNVGNVHVVSYDIHRKIRSLSSLIIAGEKADFSDAAFLEAGAIVLQGDQFFKEADIITKIRPPNDDEIPKLAGKTLIAMISPAINTELYQKLTEQKTNVFSLDNVPRMLSRAQTYDVLSSQANIAGYRAVVEAAESFPRFFAGQMTAAGKVPPAKVLVCSSVFLVEKCLGNEMQSHKTPFHRAGIGSRCRWFGGDSDGQKHGCHCTRI